MIKLHKPKEFDKRFDENLKTSKTYKEAYQKTEKEYREIFGENKYSSFKSFRNSYNSRR